MEKKRRVIKTDKPIGEGSYQVAYRVSSRRIVKVARDIYDDEQAKTILQNEIEGSKTLLNALPVLDVVDVVLPSGKIRQGTLRKYVENNVKDSEIDRMFKRASSFHDWDSYSNNYKKDTSGKIWRIDTQTKEIWNLIK